MLQGCLHSIYTPIPKSQDTVYSYTSLVRDNPLKQQLVDNLISFLIIP
jgi:hypothetical protein